MAEMHIVLCQGNNRRLPEIARRVGMRYGTRNDEKPRDDDLFMLDINWKKYDWSKYLDLARQYRPYMAMVPDYEHPSQRRLLYQRIRELKPHVTRIMVCPKFEGAIAHIPRFCIVALSVPSSYAGWLPADLGELAGRDVHLLGGGPTVQAQLIRKLQGVDVRMHSVDLNGLTRNAEMGMIFDSGRWIRAAPRTDLYEKIEHSAQHIVRYLREAEKQSQPMLL